jgi:predicted transcriptional regulator
MNATTIQIDKKIKEVLERKRIHPRETFNDIIERLIEDSEELDEKTKKELEKARKEIRNGKFKTHEQVGKELGFS